MNAVEREWQRAYALLALRLNRQVTETSGGTILIFRGPAEWKDRVEREDPPPPGRLIEAADRLLDELPFDRPRATYVSAHVRAMRAVARRLDGEKLPPAEYASQCLGIEVERVPESRFEAAHAELDGALPPSGGSLADRLQAWQTYHALAIAEMDQLPGLVAQAVAETRARTSTIIPLPPDEVVDCQVVPNAHFLAAGHYDGGLKSTIFVNGSLPFNLADLLYVVAHEGHPGHIAESLLKEIHLVDEQGRIEQQVRFMISPSFAISEGLGLQAQSIIFPGDQAQTWLNNTIFAERGIRPDGSRFAAIHHAKTVLWGVWSNAALMADEGMSESEVAAYLSRWALLSEAEVGAALGVFQAPGMTVYIHGYYHGWNLVRAWLDVPDPAPRVRRLLTEQLLPADLRTDA